MVIGIRWEGVTGGMKVIGLGHRTRGLAGWHLITMETSSLRVTGREIAAGWNMITAGTATATGISMSVNGTASRTAIGSTIGTTTASSPRRTLALLFFDHWPYRVRTAVETLGAII